MTKKILLNWMPPAMVQMPSPAMSVLKSYLVNRGFDVGIIYWNLKLYELQVDFTWSIAENIDSDMINSLLLYYNYLAIKNNDREAYSRVKSSLMSIKPNYMSADPYMYDRHMHGFAEKLDNTIEDILDEYNLSECFLVGMSVNLYQWIVSSIIAKKIKERTPDIPIIIGGIGRKDTAVAFIDNFPQFDLAIWGEGEFTLEQVAKLLSNNVSVQNIEEIPHVAYRDKNGFLKATKVSARCFKDLDDNTNELEFSDYFDQGKSLIRKGMMSVHLFVEGSRGCHWQKCHFCYLNTGYKHRLRSPKNIGQEIRKFINKYNVYNFELLDNDVVANDYPRFLDLLAELKAVRDDFPRFRVILAEIITKGMSSFEIREMSEAGFIYVQIGYESPSDSILTKIEKKNTLSSNLLFIKYAIKYGINISGANVIQGLLEETSEDIMESMINLRYMRFYLGRSKFRHDMSNLAVMSSSRYYICTLNDARFVPNNFISYLPKNFISKKNIDECTIIEKIQTSIDYSWTLFQRVERFYLVNSYSYKLFKETGRLRFKEFFNDELINELLIEENSIDYLIMSNSNHEVMSFGRLKELLKIKSEWDNISDCELFNILENLKREGLIYSKSDFSEILTIIDFDNVI